MTAFPVAIDDHEFLVDLEQYETASIEAIREQADASREFGEQSLNPVDLWRRSVDDWRFGSGQKHLDKGEALRARFFESKGVDPWERGEISLLPDTSLAFSGGGEQCLVVGDRLYFHSGGTTISYTTDLATSTATGVFPSAVLHMATDGFNIYCMTQSHGLYFVTRNNDTPALLNNVLGDKVWYVMGRLLVAAGPDLYNITDVSDTTTPEPMTPGTINSDFRWTACGEGGSFIYIAGFSGDTSLVYRVSIRQDGIELGAPTVAAPLPDGEVCYSIQGYVGVVALGTDRGVRLADPSKGYLDYGPLAETGSRVEAMEPQGRFLWFGWPDFDGSSTGLGRMDLSTFLPERGIASPFASDLMAGAQGAVKSAATFLGKRVFSVSGSGVFAESDGLVSSGWLRSGKVTFGLPDEKAFEFLRIRSEPLPAGASVGYTVAVDGAQIVSAAFSGDGGTGTDPEVELGGVQGDVVTLELTLNAGTGGSPVVTRWTMRALPIPRRGVLYNVPLILREDVTGLNGRRVQLDPEAEYGFLLSKVGRSVTYREGSRQHRAYVDAVRRGPQLSLTKHNDGFQGLVTVRLRVFE